MAEVINHQIGLQVEIVVAGNDDLTAGDEDLTAEAVDLTAEDVDLTAEDVELTAADDAIQEVIAHRVDLLVEIVIDQ